MGQTAVRRIIMSVIELKDITMSYGPNRILEHFNLSVEQGTFLTMIGSSGCGKTTALKLSLIHI